MAARALGSGTISFGLVSIPIKLYTAASSQGISFNLLHSKCGGRMKQQYFCPTDNEIVERKDMVKGYEFAKDQFVRFTDEDLKSLESPKTDSLELVEFVPLGSVDFVYIEKTYYLGPDKGGERAYKLLSQAMEHTQKIAVGRYWTRGKDQLVLIRAYKHGLVLHQVYYADEVRSFGDVEVGGEAVFKPIEEELAEKLIEQLSVPLFKPERYRDEYVDRVRAAVDQKVAGQEIVAAAEGPKAQVIDLFEALKRSLASSEEHGAENDPPAPEEEALARVESPISEPKPPKKAVPRKAAEGKKSSTG